MSPFSYLRPVATLACVLTLCPATQAAPIAIEDLARFEQLTSPNLSPDGKHVAGLYAAPSQKWPVISIWKTDALEQAPVWIPSATMRPVFVRFVGNERLIFVTEQELTVGTTKSFTRKLYLTDLKGSFFEEPLRTRGATDDAARRAENLRSNIRVFSEDLPDPNTILLERGNVDQGTQEIWKLNVTNGRAEKIAESSEDSQFLEAGVSPWTGELLLREEVEADAGGTYWLWRYYREDARSAWEKLEALSYPLKKRRSVTPVGFDVRRDKLLVLSNAETDHARMLSFDLARRTFDPEPLFSNAQYDIIDSSFARNPENNTWLGPVAIVVGAASAEQVFVDDLWAPLHASLKKQFPGRNVTLSSRNRKQSMAILTVQGGAHPPEYFLVRAGTATTLTQLGKERPWLRASDLGPVRWVSYAARDGLTIPAILTLPPGWKSGDKPVPAVVLPHGGPWSRDFLEWDATGWPQFLASRGYAVLQPQYRGSEGLGLKHWLAGDEQWGLAMQDDNDDGARWLASQGFADPKRTAIFGYSYGGFAAIAATVRPGGPFVCAISGAGVSSLGLIQNEWGDSRVQRQLQGWTVKGVDPIDNVGMADIPILLYHGDRDRQADTEHSRRFFRAMKNAKKDVEYVEIKDMWHTLPWRPEWHRQTLGLLENYLKGPKCFGAAGRN
jgi:dipeptidyl aminopeptidase/acylaminoacyl peptidase